VRGLNSEKKWNSIRDKIVESKCDIVFLQETKKEQFDSTFIGIFVHSTLIPSLSNHPRVLQGEF
jgi:hypothetical protein